MRLGSCHDNYRRGHHFRHRPATAGTSRSAPVKQSEADRLMSPDLARQRPSSRRLAHRCAADNASDLPRLLPGGGRHGCRSPSSWTSRAGARAWLPAGGLHQPRSDYVEALPVARRRSGDVAPPPASSTSPRAACRSRTRSPSRATSSCVCCAVEPRTC